MKSSGLPVSKEVMPEFEGHNKDELVIQFVRESFLDIKLNGEHRTIAVEHWTAKDRLMGTLPVALCRAYYRRRSVDSKKRMVRWIEYIRTLLWCDTRMPDGFKSVEDSVDISRSGFGP